MVIGSVIPGAFYLYLPTESMWIAFSSAAVILGTVGFFISRRISVLRNVVRSIVVAPLQPGQSWRDRELTVHFILGGVLSPSVKVRLEDFINGVGNLSNSQENMFHGILLRNYQVIRTFPTNKVKDAKTPMMALVDAKADRYGCVELNRFCQKSADKISAEISKSGHL
jgi:hypothetical protein